MAFVLLAVMLALCIFMAVITAGILCDEISRRGPRIFQFALCLILYLLLIGGMSDIVFREWSSL